MYLNFELAYKKDFTLLDVIAIQLIHQNSNGDSELFLKDVSNDLLVKLNNLDLLTMVKAKNKEQSRRSLLRLSKKGKDLYTLLTTYKANEGDELIYKFMSDVYKQLDKKQASKNKMIKLIASFRLESGMTVEEIYKICKEFVNDSENMEYNHSLERVFFAPENAYSKFNLGDSRLWNYYLNR